MLGVALVEEGVELREAGIDAPMLCCPSPPAAAATTVVAHRPDAGRLHRGRHRGAGQGGGRAGARPLAVHLKVDTGMHRVGAPPDDASALAELIAAHRRARARGPLHPLAVADEPDNPYTDEQLERFDAVRAVIAPRSAAGAGARREHRRTRSRSRGPLRPRAGRHRHLRHHAGAGARRICGRCGPAMTLGRGCR